MNSVRTSQKYKKIKMDMKIIKETSQKGTHLRSSILKGINRVEEEDQNTNIEDEGAKDTQSYWQEKEDKTIIII